jgi:hypothetical protein
MAGVISITKNLRNPKVSVGYADNARSETFQDLRFAVCPVASFQDNYGRPVSTYGSKILTGGCNSANARIDVENNVWRPYYHPWLNVPEGIQQADYEKYVDDTSNRDMMGVARDRSFGLHGHYYEVSTEPNWINKKYVRSSSTQLP